MIGKVTGGCIKMIGLKPPPLGKKGVGNNPITWNRR